MPGFRHYLLGILLAATCSSIICGSGCDFLVPGECRGDGGLYGPCVDHACVDDLTCFSGLAGEMCVTNVAAGEADELCAAPIGGTGISTEPTFEGLYLIRCQNDGDCHAGTVCDEINGACLYPYGPHNVQPPPGAELGPCDPNLETGCGYHLDVCAESPEGSMCIQKDHPEWLVWCVDDADCPSNGQLCSDLDGFCVWPKE